MFFAKIFRRFFFSIDEILFNFIGTLYDLLMAISRTSILTQGDIASFAARIEVLLGIFMLFKVSFSLITYVVNPDDFSDKSKGFGKLIQNSVISLILLVLVPYIFQMAFSLQTKVLEGNVLARLILGEDLQQSGVEDNFLNEAGEKMAYYVMLPFFKPNYSINLGEGSDLSECINIYERDEETDKNVFSQACKDALISVNENQGNGMDNTDVENYANGITNQSLGLTFRMNAAVSTVGTDSDEQFVIDYKSIISTVVAVIVCLLLVSFCIDIGIRSIKLAFLQLIYPIPVISFMDPKGGKDGMFSKWYKMCFSTFVSLFVRLLALYFGLYIISKVGRFGVYDVVNGSQITNGWVMIFVIIGVLMFIKQLPKILENMGIKLEGEGKFSLNPLKKLEEGMPIGGERIKKMRENWKKDGYGIGLGAKKMISGIDSARAGKGFMNGMRKIQGNGALSRASKWYHDLTPDRTEQVKKSREAKADLNHKAKMYEEGKANLARKSKYAGKAGNPANMTIKENISKRKKDIAQDFVDSSGNAKLSVDRGDLNKHYEALGNALVEQYGGNTSKNREYARVSVEKTKAETEMRRLNALQRQAYDPNTGKFVSSRIAGATDLSGSALDSAEALEAAIETQQKILKSVGEYADREKDFQYKNGAVDDAIGVSKGMRPRRNDLKP